MASAPELDPPKGVLLLGVQGCGKSLAARAAAGIFGVPLLRLDFGALYSKWHGESEKNLRESLAAAEALSPCVLWIDEIEKALADGEGDSGTSRRVLGTFLTWLAEQRARIFVVATANDISALPPELIRKGRLDEIFFVDLPDEAARAAILAIHARKRSVQLTPQEVLALAKRSCGFLGSRAGAGDRGHALQLACQRPARQPAHRCRSRRQEVLALAKRSAGFSGAELEQAIVAALYSARAGGQPVNAHSHRAGAENNQAAVGRDGGENRALRAWAQERTVPRELRQYRHCAGVTALADAGRCPHQTITDRIPLLALRHILHEDLLAPSLVQRTQVRVKIVAILLRTASGVDPRDVLVGFERQPLSEHCDPAASLGERGGMRIDLASRHDRHLSRWSVVR